MTSHEFKLLVPGEEVEIDDKTENDNYVYQVIATDKRMGRIQMAKIIYRVQSTEYDIDWEYDTYDEAMEVIDEYKNLWPSDIEEEIEKGSTFWMDYRQVYKHY